MSLTEEDQKGDPTKKCKVIPQANDMEVDNQVTQTLNHNIHENSQINSAINLVENESMGKEEEPMYLDGVFEEQDSIDIVDNLFILNKAGGRAAAITYFE
eukprot:12249357-Ditylum_brightwellii.AAC.1